MKIFQSIAILGLVGIVAGCQNKIDYAYLMQHPKQLHQALAHCRALTSLSTDEDLSCKEVKRAAADFMAILSEQQLDPEKFGKRVLQAEYQLALLKQKRNELERAPLNTTTSQELTEVIKLYQEKKAEIKTMLVVIGVQSPE